jgi:hypothetical protein
MAKEATESAPSKANAAVNTDGVELHLNIAAAAKAAVATVKHHVAMVNEATESAPS